MVNSKRATDAQINILINTHLAEFYGKLVESGPPDYFSTDYALTTTPGTIAYALPSDFRSLISLCIKDDTRRRPVYSLRAGTLAQYDAPQSAVQLELRYVPAAPKLTTDADAVTGSVDGVSGWDELIVQLCARALMRRERRDTSAFDIAVAEKRAEILSQARDRSLGGPKYIQDIDEEFTTRSRWTSDYSIDAWSLRAGYLDIYQGSSVYP